MDYKKKYEEAISRAKVINPGTTDYNIVTEIFPELKESEDERIRKDLIGYFEVCGNRTFAHHRVSDIIVWLEKQREQNKQHLYDTIIALWNLLDKIDTFSDLQIDDTNPDNPFRKIEDITQERHKFVKSDGYNLYIKGEQITDFKQGEHKCDCKYVGCHVNDVKRWCHKKQAEILYENCNTECSEYLNKQHLELKAGHWYFCHQAYCERADILTVKEGETFKCEKDGIVKGLIIKEPEKYFREISTPSDKVEPKFKNGQWIVFNGLTLLVNEVVQGYYRTVSKCGITNSYDWNIDNAARLWTIQDAKDGDVLATDNGGICIFDGTVEEGKYPFAYCGVTERGFEFYDGKLPFTHVNVQPATKEQRELLFSKMKEAGYEWDAEKKELVKVEQKPTDKVEPKFKVGDWIINSKGMLRHIVDVDKTGYQTDNGWLTHDDYEKEFHLWTIQDAKNGDILSYTDTFNTTWVFLYKHLRHVKLLGDFHPIHYYGLVKSGDFYSEGTMLIDVEYITPSTTEQRDILFQKMKEAGYEWDAEKKELRKIEQKPAGKVEPKFHAGDFITDGERIFQIKETVWERNNRNDGSTYCESLVVNLIDGNTYSNNTDLKEYHLWTIQDAKDGDVLVADSRPFIFRGFLNKHHPERPVSYCGIDRLNTFYIPSVENNSWTRYSCLPATKDQRDLLFSKMKEAGYEWDAENKELRKIERKHAWSEEDEKMFSGINSIVEDWYNTMSEKEKEYYGDCGYIDWLKSIKERMKGE